MVCAEIDRVGIAGPLRHGRIEQNVVSAQNAIKRDWSSIHRRASEEAQALRPSVRIDIAGAFGTLEANLAQLLVVVSVICDH